MYVISIVFHGAGMSIRDQIREVCAIGAVMTYDEIEMATGLPKKTLHNTLGNMSASGEFEVLERGLLKRVKKMPGPQPSYMAPVLAALSLTEPRGTEDIMRETGLKRTQITSTLCRLKNHGLVRGYGKAQGNGSARYLLTGRDKIHATAAQTSEFVMPEDLPSWLTMPVIHKPGRVVTFWSAGE